MVFTDEPGTDRDSYTVPAVEGVEYLVDGEVVAAGTYPGAGTVTVTARALDGFVLADGATTEWSHTFSSEGEEPEPEAEPEPEPGPEKRTAEFHLSNSGGAGTDGDCRDGSMT